MSRRRTKLSPTVRNLCHPAGTERLSPSGGRPDDTRSDHKKQRAWEPRYFVGLDQSITFRERVQEIHGNDPEVTDAVSQLDEYFSTRSFEDRPEVQRFVGRVRRSVENPSMADEITGELINHGYVTALRRLGYKDASENVAFSREYARTHGISFADAFIFGPGGAARIALAEWLIDQRLHGMHRPGKGPGAAFSDETRKMWHVAEYKHRPWPQIEGKDGGFSPAEIPAEQGKLPQGVEELMRDSWRRYLRQGKGRAYTGMRPLRCGQNYEMIEDMVCVLLEAGSGAKVYRSPLDRAQQFRYDRIIEEANKKGIEAFYSVCSEMFSDTDALRPVWNKARRILYEYSSTLREAAIEAGLIERPDSIGITWRDRHGAWQAQIAYKGRQRYLGLFKDMADAQSAYCEAAAKMGHIQGMPDIDRIWPTWKQEKARLALMRERPRMPVVYQQQDTHKERKYGRAPPEAMRELVERMKSVDWLVKHCILVFDDNWPTASQEIAIKSRGRQWYEEIKKRGKRFVIQGCTSIYTDAGRITITIYRPGYGNDQVLAEEIYHIVFGLIRKANPKMHKATQRWHKRRLKNGADPTVCLDEAFSKSMALAESGVTTSLPRNIVKQAREIFSSANSISDAVIEQVKGDWSVP